jgi:hypothetical protein
MLWNSHISHEEKVQIIADLARIICHAGRPTINASPLEAFTLEAIPDVGYYADDILTIRIDPSTTMMQDEDRGGVVRQVDGNHIAISYGPTRVFTAQVVDSMLAHDDAQYCCGQWEDHLMKLGVHAIGVLRDHTVYENGVLTFHA